MIRSLIILCIALACSLIHAADGSKADPLQVMLIPADGGTADGTIADFQPIFNAISKAHGIHFTISVGQSYSTVIEAMANKQIDVAFFGAVSFLETKKRGGAELLAVAVKKGSSSYFSGIFVGKNSGINTIADLKGKTMAFGDVHSTSSFNYPMAMLIADGFKPLTDLDKIFMAGSHVNSLKALNEGKVDACAASFSSFEKAINNGAIDPAKFKVLKRSEPIPYPPMAMHPELPSRLKLKLRYAFDTVHESPQVTPDMIRGYGGKKVDRYDATFPEKDFLEVGLKLSKVTDEFKAAVLKQAASR